MSRHGRRQSRYPTRSQGKTRSYEDDEPSPMPSQAAKLLISIDPGTDFTKAAYKVIFANNAPSQPGNEPFMFSDLKTIIWDNTTSYVRTQITYTWDATVREWKFRWGNEVDQAVHGDDVQVTDIIRCFKPMVFGQDVGRNARSREQISKLPQLPREEKLLQHLKESGQETHETEITDIDLFVWFIRHARWYVLRCIAEAYPSLGIPIHDPTDLKKYGDWKPPAQLKITYALPLPAASSPYQIERMTAACSAAGMHDPYSVAEPLCILYLQLRLEQDNLVIGKLYIVVDIGAGSADIEAWRVVELNPTRVEQVGRSRTAWGGGNGLTENCINYILSERPGIPEFIQAHNNTGHDQPWETLRYTIEAEFEERRKSFNGTDRVTLKVPELPAIPNSKLCSMGKITLQAQDVKMIFTPIIEEISVKITELVDEVGGTNFVYQIPMGGGTSSSRYLRKDIRHRLHPIPVTFPTEHGEGSRGVAQGAVGLLANRHLIRTRIIGHGYAFAQLKLVEDFPPNHFPEHCVHQIGINGNKQVNVSVFFFRAEASLPFHHVAPRYRGYRELRLCDRVTIGGRACWIIQEALYYCSDPAKCIDDVAVEDPTNQIFEMPNPVLFELDYSYHENWTVIEHGEEDYFLIEYEVVLILDGERLRFELIIPHGGIFGAEDRDPAFDIKVPAEYNVAGRFDLVNRAR